MDDVRRHPESPSAAIVRARPDCSAVAGHRRQKLEDRIEIARRKCLTRQLDFERQANALYAWPRHRSSSRRAKRASGDTSSRATLCASRASAASPPAAVVRWASQPKTHSSASGAIAEAESGMQCLVTGRVGQDGNTHVPGCLAECPVCASSHSDRMCESRQVVPLAAFVIAIARSLATLRRQLCQRMVNADNSRHRAVTYHSESAACLLVPAPAVTCVVDLS